MKTRVFLLIIFQSLSNSPDSEKFPEIHLTNSCKSLNDRLTVALRTFVDAKIMIEQKT